MAQKAKQTSHALSILNKLTPPAKEWILRFPKTLQDKEIDKVKVFSFI